MSFPETTYEQAEALLKTPDFAPYLVYINGQNCMLTAKLVQKGRMLIPNVDGWYTMQDAYEIKFEGGQRYPHIVRLASSTPKQILAHWNAYKSAHSPEVVPQHKSSWIPKVGDEVYFPRGMYGKWRGTIHAISQARGSYRYPTGTLIASIRYLGSNGRWYVRRGVMLTELTHHGKKPKD